jgi:hypothetical protein
MRALLCLLVTTLLFGVTACETIPAARPDTIDAGPPVSYYADVRPLLVQHCTMCHKEGGIAPFELGTYDDARDHAVQMMRETTARRMPPFLADNSGTCNQWANYRGLTDDEISLISSWVLQGAPMGDPSTPAPAPVSLPTLPSVEVTLQMPLEYNIDTSIDDDYRCFVVDSGTTANLLVRGYDVMPGNQQRVHHVIVYNPNSATAADQAVTLDRNEGALGDGYTCFGAAGVDATPLVLWAPGAGATLFPTALGGVPTGIPLVAGRKQIIQVHYNNNHNEDAPTTDRTTIQLTALPDTCSSQPALLIPVADFGLSLPPGDPDAPASYTWHLADFGVPPFAAIPLYGLFPHMHMLGTSLEVDRIRETGEVQCLINVPRWDFNWQSAYFLQRPIQIYGTDSVRITCHYDTSERTAPVTWGEGTMDEMCLSYAYVLDIRPRTGC